MTSSLQSDLMSNISNISSFFPSNLKRNGYKNKINLFSVLLSLKYFQIKKQWISTTLLKKM